MNHKKYYKIDPKYMYGFDNSKMYETKIIYRDMGVLCSESYPEPYEAWCCIYCLRERRIKYIATGHDHTDYDFDVCDCEGAKKNGKPWKELF